MHRTKIMSLKTHPEALQGRHLPNGLGIAYTSLAAYSLEYQENQPYTLMSLNHTVADFAYNCALLRDSLGAWPRLETRVPDGQTTLLMKLFPESNNFSVDDLRISDGAKPANRSVYHMQLTPKS